MSGRVQVLPLEIPGGAIIHAEVMLTEGGQDVSAVDMLRLDHAREMLRHVAAWAVETAQGGMPRRPDEFEVSFGMKLGVKSGKLIGILAEAGSEATFAIRMTWARSVDFDSTADVGA